LYGTRQQILGKDLKIQQIPQEVCAHGTPEAATVFVCQQRWMKSGTIKQNLRIQLQPQNQPAVPSVEKPVLFAFKENLSCTSHMLPYNLVLFSCTSVFISVLCMVFIMPTTLIIL